MASKTLKKVLKSAGIIHQDEHLGSGNLKKVMDGLIVPPKAVLATTLNTTAAYVGRGNILRMRTSAATFVLFGNSSMTAPVGTEANSLELNSADVYLIVAADDYVMTSVAPARTEVIDAITDKFGSPNAAANPEDYPA